VKIVDRAAFLAMPKGTVYAKYTPSYFNDLAIKDDTLTGGTDWFYQDIIGSIYCNDTGDFCDQLDASQVDGLSVRMDFEALGRDGLFEKDQLFAVWEPEDVRGLIGRLERALADAEEAAA
jgi:hypothetical protein